MSSTSQVDWSPNCEFEIKLGRQKEFFTHSNIFSSSYLWTDFNFKHQSYCFGSRGVVSWAAGVWEGGWGSEGTVSLISLKCCALCLCAGGIPPATLVQSKQAGATSCTTLPNSSPSCQQNETAPTFKHIHVIYSWVIARALPSLTLDDGKGWLHQQRLTTSLWA